MVPVAFPLNDLNLFNVLWCHLGLFPPPLFRDCYKLKRKRKSVQNADCIFVFCRRIVEACVLFWIMVIYTSLRLIFSPRMPSLTLTSVLLLAMLPPLHSL